LPYMPRGTDVSLFTGNGHELVPIVNGGANGLLSARRL
jgi:hypothetical protein